jgi:hypothetical protein
MAPPLCTAVPFPVVVPEQDGNNAGTTGTRNNPRTLLMIIGDKRERTT